MNLQNSRKLRVNGDKRRGTEYTTTQWVGGVPHLKLQYECNKGCGAVLAVLLDLDEFYVEMERGIRRNIRRLTASAVT